MKPTRNLYALISCALSYVSYVLFFGYVKYHGDLMKAQSIDGESVRLSWNIIDGLKLASNLAAITALILAIIAVIRGPKRYGMLALMLAALACLTFFAYV